MKANDITLLDPDQCWMRFIRKIPCHYNSVQEMSEPTTILQAFEKADRSYDNESVQLYVYADYVKPNSRVEFLRYTCDGLLISQDFMVPAVRKEALPNFKLNRKVDQIKKVFDRSKTVFKNWKPDTRKSLASCKMLDFSYWRIPILSIFK